MPAHGFRDFSPALRRFFVATVVNMLGSAALFGFVLIYFHEVRHISLGQSGIAVGAMSFTMVILTPVGGTLSDRWGARTVLALGCVVSIVAGSLYMVVASFPAALGVSVLLGAGNALWFPSQQALLALIVTPDVRPTLSAYQRVALNLGAALGAAVAGFIVVDNSLASFRWLFALNVATYFVFLAVLPGMPPGRIPPEERSHQPLGFGHVISDRFFLRLLVTDISVALGFGFLFALMPAYASRLGIGKGTIGVLFGFGALSVVATQIPTLRWARGRPRMKSLAVMNLWFAAAFALMTLTAHVAIPLAVVLLGIAQVLGGFGEAVLGAVRTPLTSDLAPPELVGRYFGLATMVFQGSMGAANAIGGVLLEHSLTTVWVLPLVVALAGAAGSLGLRHHIPDHAAISP